MATKGFERVLLAIDDSEQAQAAINATLALGRESKVRVVHVWNLETHHRHGHLDVEMRHEASKLLEAAVGQLKAAGVVAEMGIYRADSRHVAEAIGQAAKEFDANLVVMGSRELSDWKAITTKSVSHHVLAAVDCPVLVVCDWRGSDKGEPRRVLLAIVGGDDVEMGVSAVSAMAAVMETKVMVVHVAQAIFGAQGFVYVEPEDEIKTTMAEAIQLLKERGVSAEGMVAHGGGAGRTVVERAEEWKADLIVTGGGRMGDLASLLLGSVSHDLLHESKRPVLVAGRFAN